jgi:hypothetical protein
VGVFGLAAKSLKFRIRLDRDMAGCRRHTVDVRSAKIPILASMGTWIRVRGYRIVAAHHKAKITRTRALGILEVLGRSSVGREQRRQWLAH